MMLWQDSHQYRRTIYKLIINNMVDYAVKQYDAMRKELNIEKDSNPDICFTALTTDTNVLSAICVEILGKSDSYSYEDIVNIVLEFHDTELEIGTHLIPYDEINKEYEALFAEGIYTRAVRYNDDPIYYMGDKLPLRVAADIVFKDADCSYAIEQAAFDTVSKLVYKILENE